MTSTTAPNRISKIRYRGGPEYVRQCHLVAFPDLQLVSNDGFVFLLHRAVLSAASPDLQRVLLESASDPSATLSVDVSSEHLQIIVRFVTTGCIPAKAAGPSLIKSFKHLGIDVFGMTFTKVEEKDQATLETLSKALAPQRLDQLKKKQRNLEDNALPPELEDFILEPVQGGEEEEEEEDEEDDPDYDPPESSEDELMGPQSSERSSRSRFASQFPKEGERDVALKHQCGKCFFGCRQTRTLVQHELRHRYSTAENNLFFFCTICEEGFSKDRDLMDHRKARHQEVVLDCPHCPRSFLQSSKKALARHVRDHAVTGDGKCAHCGVQCSGLISLKYHQLLKGEFHSNHCAQCRESVTSWSQHQDHVDEAHDGVWKYACGVCGANFNSKDEVRSHRASEHDGKPMVKFCNLCGKYVTNLRVHKLEKHANDKEKSFYCDKCPKQFARERNLKSHQKIHTYLHRCDICGKQATCAATLEAHIIRKHKDPSERPFKCPHCEKAYIEKIKLDDHMNRHTGNKPYTCSFCDQAFATYASKHSHEMRHKDLVSGNKNGPLPKLRRGRRPKQITGYEDIKGPCTCDQCGHQSKSGQLLYFHILSFHTEDADKPYKCEICGKGFATKVRLLDHNNVHTDARPYLCQHCGKGFNSQGTRDGHVKGVHLGEKYPNRKKRQTKN